ncbi:MAG: gfo/Idh/MocA family oxidoreductase, partial [Alphaproteobacteria bacterium]|nr:gfo/Idh/MocA family oxidoreductase [Alphaproteobacteria bacterium]
SQPRVNTPMPVWNPDVPQTMKFHDHWQEVPDNAPTENGFKMQWEMFVRHLYEDGPWEYTLLSGAKGVQLAELGLKSWAERRWLDVPELGD